MHSEIRIRIDQGKGYVAIARAAQEATDLVNRLLGKGMVLQASYSIGHSKTPDVRPVQVGGNAVVDLAEYDKAQQARGGFALGAYTPPSPEPEAPAK